MIRSRVAWLLVPLVAAPAIAAAQPRELCPDRPGLTTPPCTVESGHVEVETGFGWSLMRGDDVREDDFDLGDTLVRIGVAEHGEVRLGWTALGLSRIRDRATGAVMHDAGVGDLTVSFRRNLRNPDGSGTSIAVQPYVTLPTGTGPLDSGTWSAGLIVPAAFALTEKLTLSATAEADAAADADGEGRHFAYELDAGLSVAATEKLTVSVEGQIRRDLDDAAGHSTMAQAGMDLAWQTGRNTQFDVGGTIGLNRDSPDVGFYAGVTRRF